MRVWRSLVVLIIAAAVVAVTPTSVAAQEEAPSIQIPYDPIVSIDLTRPDRGSLPYRSSHVSTTSTDGRYLLVINRYGTDLYGGPDSVRDLSQYDLATGNELHFSPTWNGDALDQYITSIGMSDDGRHLAFATNSSNVIFGGVETAHGYHFDLETRQPQLISVRPDGSHGRYSTDHVALTPDGRYAVFSTASGLTTAHGSGVVQVYRWDRTTGTSELVSATAEGTAANVFRLSSNPFAATRPSISDDGRFITFISYSTNLVADELPGADGPHFPEKAYLKDMASGVVVLLSRDAHGPLDVKSLDAQITGDGNIVVYNNFPFKGFGTAWRWDRRSGERTPLMIGSEAIGSPYFSSISQDGLTMALRPEGLHYGNGTRIDHHAAGESSASENYLVGLIDRSGHWAIRRQTTPEEGTTAQLEVFTRSIPVGPKETCGSADLSLAAGARPLDDQVVRLYQAVFGRAPDEAGLSHWIDRRAAGASLSALAAEFAKSPEWANRYGTNASTDEVITLLYRNVLDRVPDAEGFTFWQNSKFTVPQLIVSFSDSVENVNRTSTSPPMTSAQGAICRLYLGVFDRAPDSEGLRFWTNRIEGGQSVQSVAAEFTASPEWDQTYGSSPTPFSLVTDLYRNVFGRTADIGGVRFWVQLSDEGLSEAALLEQFVQSAEFIKSTGTAP